jgi:hypothetical protein
LCPLAVLKRWRLSVKLGPDSIVFSAVKEELRKEEEGVE